MTDRTYGPAGGGGGEAFEAHNAPEGAHIAAVHVWSGFFVDGIQVFYRDAAGQETEAAHAGGHGGIHHVFTLEAGEHLVGISGRCANYIDSLCLHTNKRNSESYGGWGGATEYSITAPAGSEIVGIFGRAGWFIDALGVVTRAQAAQGAEAAPAPKSAGRKAKASAAVEPAPAETAPAPESAPAAKQATPAASKQKSTPAKAPAAVVAATAKSPNPVELEKIEGIGPKLAQVLVDNGINDLADLAATPVERLREILAGARYKLADPSTWPAQAALGAQGDWAGFAKLQAELKGGRKR